MCDAVSFRNVEYWLKKIRKHGDEHAEVLLLANKIDLVNDRVVSEEDARALAAEYGVAHLETTAKDYLNVERSFKQLVSNIIHNEQLQDKITVQPKDALAPVSTGKPFALPPKSQNRGNDLCLI